MKFETMQEALLLLLANTDTTATLRDSYTKSDCHATYSQLLMEVIRSWPVSQSNASHILICLSQLEILRSFTFEKIRFVWINERWKWMNQAQKSGYYVSIFFWIALGRLVFRDGCKFGAAESNILWPRFQKKVLRQKISHLLLTSSAGMLE